MIVDQLQYLNDIKKAIKSAITAKGVVFDNSTPFMRYVDQIELISGGKFLLALLEDIVDLSYISIQNIRWLEILEYCEVRSFFPITQDIVDITFRAE